MNAKLLNTKHAPVASQRDLGLTVQQDVSWNGHCQRQSKRRHLQFCIKRNPTANLDY